jgi:Anti-sigma-K factor rskA
MMHDDELLDSIAVLALGAMPAAEAEALRTHVESCEECMAEYRALRGAADAVGYDAEAGPAELDEVRSARMRANLMRTIRQDAAPSAMPARAASGLPRRQPWVAYLAIAASLIVALLSAVNNVALRSQHGLDQERIVTLQRSLDAQAKSANDLRNRLNDSDARLAALLSPSGKHFPIAQGQVIESGGRIFLALHSLSALAPNKVYQAWTLAKGAKTVAPSVTFRAGGDGTALIELPESAGNLAAVALSVEPAGGSRQPTSKPSFVRKLS